MTIDVFTLNPKQLESDIFNAVGKTLETWIIKKSDNGKVFLTPVASQYKDEVLLQFHAFENKLRVYHTYWSNRAKPNNAVNAIVIGMFTATLLTHFGEDFTKLEITN